MFIEINPCLIQPDATNDVVVNSFFFGVTNNRVYSDVFRTFTFSMQQSESFVSTRTTIWQKRISIILSILDFKLGNCRKSERLLANMGEFFFSFIYIYLYIYSFLCKNTNTNFLLDIGAAYKRFVWTAAL